MKANQDQIMVAIDKYVQNEILAKAPNGFEKFKLGFVYGALKNKIPQVIIKLKENSLVQMMELIDAEGFVDVDKVLQYAKESMSKTGKVIIGGISFSENDLTLLYNYLREL